LKLFLPIVSTKYSSVLLFLYEPYYQALPDSSVVSDCPANSRFIIFKQTKAFHHSVCCEPS